MGAQSGTLSGVTADFMPVAPPVYGRWAPIPLMATSGRLWSAVLALGCLALLITAATLPPSPTGVGTHRGLHLSGCAFLTTTGYPCPACGMTTSFSWFVRGNWIASGYVQPMGMVLAAICAMVFWGGMWTAVTGRSVRRVTAIVPDSWYLFPLLGIALAAWVWKIWIHSHGLDGWR